MSDVWQKHAQRFEDQYFELISNPIALRRALHKLKDVILTDDMVLRAIDLENNRLNVVNCTHAGTTKQNIVDDMKTEYVCSACGSRYLAILTVPEGTSK